MTLPQIYFTTYESNELELAGVFKKPLYEKRREKAA